MPKAVWVLSADEFCKGAGTNGSDKRCTLGWIDEIFPGHFLKVAEAFRKELGTSCITWNDAPRRSLAELARFFNWMTAHRFGYVVGNPEAKRTRP